MKLIKELTEEISHEIVESVDGKKNLYIVGPFAQAELKNRNGRIYPRGVMEEAVSNYVSERVARKSAWGELGHPVGPKINETLVSHLIEQVSWDGNNVMGRAKVTLGTPNGKTLAGLIESGGSVGVSTRALGSVKQNSSGLMEVQQGLKFATLADAVLDPSAPDAFVNGIMESVDYFWDAADGTWVESRIDPMRKAMKQMSKAQLEERKLALFEAFLNGLSKTV